MNDIMFYDPVTTFDFYIRIGIGIGLILIIIACFIQKKVDDHREKKFWEEANIDSDTENKESKSTDEKL